MLLRLDGQSLVRRAVGRVIDAGARPVVVVTGHEPDLLRTELADVDCTFVHNPDFSGPTSTSLHCALRALPASTDAAVIVLGDMPRATTAMLQALIAAADESDASLAVSRYGDVFAPPLLFRRSLFAELLAWHGEGCGKQVVMRHVNEAAIRDWPAAALFDVDTPDDYEGASG